MAVNNGRFGRGELEQINPYWYEELLMNDDPEPEMACPCCGALWGFEELEEGHCWSCGWPEERCDDDETDDYPMATKGNPR